MTRGRAPTVVWQLEDGRRWCSGCSWQHGYLDQALFGRLSSPHPRMGGFDSYCMVCRQAALERSRNRHRDEQSAYQKAWYQANRERLVAAKRRRRAEVRARRLRVVQQRVYRAAKREQREQERAV